MKIILRDGTRPRPYMVLALVLWVNNELSNLASGRNVTTRIAKIWTTIEICLSSGIS